MKNIIFLDIDGVLNDNSSDDFVLESVNVLKELVKENDAKVVVISSWQGTGTKARRDKTTKKLSSVGIDVYDYINPNFNGELGDVSLSSRAIGIIDYLRRNSSCNYVILDDEYHNDYKMMCLNYFRPNMWVGLREKDKDKIYFKSVNLNILNRVTYRYRELGDYEKSVNNLVGVLKKVLEKKKKE